MMSSGSSSLELQEPGNSSGNSSATAAADGGGVVAARSKALLSSPLAVIRAGQRAFGRLTRRGRRRQHSNSNSPAANAVVATHPASNATGPLAPFWSAPFGSQQPAALLLAAGPSWLLQPLRQLLWQEEPGQASDGGAARGVRAAASTSPAATTSSSSSGSRANRRRERRAARQQRRTNKRLQQELRKASKHKGSSSSHGALTAHGSGSSDGALTVGPVRQGSAASSGLSAHVLAHMINTTNSFPMLLHSAQHLLALQAQATEQQQQLQHTAPASHHSQSSSSSSSGAGEQQQQLQQQTRLGGQAAASSSSGRPQQLLTVGCRRWGNMFKLYEFAIYVDPKQAQAQLPTTPLSLEGQGPSSGWWWQQQQQQPPQAEQQRVHQPQQPLQQQGGDLPALLKSSSSQVDMSLVLKAARDVPLHLLSAEYEKVLRRRLARVGGSHADVTALQQLLASFSDASRLPAAVTAGGSSSSSSSSSGAGHEAGPLPAAGGSGSVRKGAMIVLSRSPAGDVTARVGPAILTTVSSPKVAEALFDLYLGDQPVSKAAKEAAAQTLQRIAAAGSEQVQQHSSSRLQPQPATHYLPSSRGHEIQCEGKAAVGRRAGKRGSGRQEPTGAQQGLAVEELSACVLHMG